MSSNNAYQILDSGNGRKLEKIGDYSIIRPSTQAFWDTQNPSVWNSPDSEFNRRSDSKGSWSGNLPNKWQIEYRGLKWNIVPNEFGNIGVFFEHLEYTSDLLQNFDKNDLILNLFSYSGSSVMPLLKEGYKVVAVDSSKQSMALYTANLELNQISRDGQKLILEDGNKFLKREARRGNKYKSIILDPPTVGKGTKGEVFSIEKDLLEMLLDIKNVAANQASIVMTLHSPKFTQIVLENLLAATFLKAEIKVRELFINVKSGLSLPSGYLCIVKTI